jgi:hypothetical protein
MGTAIGAILGIILIAALIGVILGGFFMLTGAKIAGVKNATFGNAILTSFACIILGVIISLVFSVIPIIGTVIGFFASLLIQIFIIKSMFDTDAGKALLTWVFNVVAQVIAIIIAVVILGSSLAAAANLHKAAISSLGS